ncbi:MAG TPA: class I SAM-dependent methyltransferase [Ilumatobacteraceae bacterium]|nr:class I SAM-dependent methyltransferase [Ilumatobacteraceae bacterium]
MATTRHREGLLPVAIAGYIAERTAPPDDVLTRLQARTAELGRAAGMQIGADQGALLTLLTRLVGARQAVEVGTFTGYSSICIARGLAPGGHLLCCDVSEEYTAIARAAWADAGLGDVIELRLAPAVETLRTLPEEATIDLAFIDADKGGYATYFDELVPRVRPGGVLLVDNTLWSGRVVDDAADDADTVALRAFNDKVAADERVESYLLPIGDGLTLVRKR